MFDEKYNKFDLFEFARTTATDEAKKAVKCFYGLKKEDVKYKTIDGHRSPVSICDVDINNSIVKKISDKFPAHSILTEEAGYVDRHSVWMWVIDPIDGTRHYIEQRQAWSISIGLFYKNKPFLGVVYAPLLDKMYSALKNEGVYLNNKRFYLQSHRKDKYKVLLISSSNPVWIKRRNKYIDIFKSVDNVEVVKMQYPTTVSFMEILEGVYDAVIVVDANLWDVGGMAAVLEEAGCRVVNGFSDEWDATSKIFFAAHEYAFQELYEYFKQGYDYKS